MSELTELQNTLNDKAALGDKAAWMVMTPDQWKRLVAAWTNGLSAGAPKTAGVKRWILGVPVVLNAEVASIMIHFEKAKPGNRR